AALVGFAALGLGLAVVVPVVYSATASLPGHNPGHAIAAISTCGWFGFLVGPPLIGVLADLTTLSVALGIIPILVAGIALAAGTLRPIATG
ncbi:MAG: MFS transporter, partial [Dactylosporangium sp.]|nr:MFS transporter [Dactylosporangium sp.]NNJ60680.1 MFS transporter [Dactylosporangium sp.]